MQKSKIEWCTHTWNPVTGCDHGCEYCYARRIANRFKPRNMELMNIAACKPTIPISAKNLGCYEADNPVYLENFKGEIIRRCAYPMGFKPTYHRYKLDEPSRSKTPKNIFTISMGDLFGEWVPKHWINDVFDACSKADRHRYLFLTKNPKRIDIAIDDYSGEDRGSEDCYMFFENFWFGTSITCEADLAKIPEIEKIEEGNRFLSIEPLLSPVQLKLEKSRCPVCGSSEIYNENPMTSTDRPWYCDCCGQWESSDGLDQKTAIDWVIIGAESGNRKAKVIPKREWVEGIVNRCKEAGVPVFLKNSLASLWGKPLIQEMPEGLRNNASV